MKKFYLINLLPIVFVMSLLSGQLVRIPFFKGIIYPHDIILGISLLFGFLFREKKVIFRFPKSIIVSFILFCIISFLTILFQIPTKGMESAGIGLLYLLRFFYYCVGSVVLVKLYPKINWLHILYSFGTIFSILGIFQFFLYPDLRNLTYLGWDPHYYRLFSTLLDPNFAGIIIVLTILLGLYVYKKNSNNYLLLVSLGVNGISLLLTLSRSSYVSFCIAIVFLIVAKKQWRWLVGLVFFVLLMFVITTPGGNIFSQLRITSAMARIINWEESITLIQASPILGNGFYMLKTLGESTIRAFGYLDNSLLFVFATTGVFGFASFIFFLSQLFASAKKSSKIDMKLSFIYSASLIAVIVHSFFVNSLFYPWVIIWMGVLTGT